jgi:phosphonate transport system substrate-binding protein
VLRLFMALLLICGLAGQARAEDPATVEPIRFGLTAVVVKENLRFLDSWARYLSDKMGQPIEFVRRRSYREVMDLLKSGSLDFAWICGFPFVQHRDPDFLTLMAVPIYNGKPLYHSFIIVHKDSPYGSMDDLRDKVFAFSDPESNSGFLYPQSLLAKQGHTPERFFRQTFFTFNHAETVEAVAEQVADGGAVDSYIWEYLRTYRPEVAANTRVIRTSPTFGFPPLVSRVGVDPGLVERMKQVFLEMAEDAQGREFLDGLKLDGFGDFPPSLFESISEMVEETRKAQIWLTSAPASQEVVTEAK